MGSIRKAAFLAAMLLCFSATKGSAAEISVSKLDDTTTAIFIIGKIEASDGKKFKSEASIHDNAVVFLESNGGSTMAAIEIGESIRLKGYATVVLNDSECNSACALIWLAGSPRALSKSGRVGFHATYTDASGTLMESGVGNAIVGRYFTVLNLPVKAIVFATAAPPEKLNWLNASNYGEVGIEVKLVDDLEESPSQSNTDQTFQSSKSESESRYWKNFDHWSVLVDDTLDSSCFLISNFTNGTVFRIGFDLRDGINYYLMFTNSAWTSLVENETYDLNFKFDSETPWEVPVRVVTMGGTLFLLANFSDSLFWTEFVKAATLSITRESKNVTSLSMAGSALAFDELINCQKTQNLKRRMRDPFAD